MEETGYIFLKTNHCKNNIKYEVGKRYHGKINFCFELHDFDDNIFINCDLYKILQIKLYKYDDANYYDAYAYDFKIIKEIDYKIFKDNFEVYRNSIYILGIKYKDKNSLSALLAEPSEYNMNAIINANVDDYIISMLNNDEFHYWQPYVKIIKKYGKNILLNKINSTTQFIKERVQIAKLGIPEYLDKFSDEIIDEVIGEILKNGRNKDINNFSNKKKMLAKNFDVNIIKTVDVNIIKTGIDKFLDEYMDYIDIPILMEISKVGRKKDLDIFVNSPLEEIRSIVASHGYDEHLDMLVNDESKMVLQSVLDMGRDKDIKIIKSSPFANELNFPNNIK